MNVDVIIPTRDRPDLTDEAVRSVLNQTHTNLRVLVVDDASSGPALHSITDTRVDLIRRSIQGGPQAARQSGLESSDAPFVALLDSDDLWKPSKLESQLTRLVSGDNVQAVLTWHQWTHGHDVLSIVRPHGPTRPNMTNNMSSPVFTRESLDSVGGFYPPGTPVLPTMEHVEFWVRYTACSEVAVIPQVLTICRSHTGTRESDFSGSAAAAAAVVYVVEAHKDSLANHPDYLAELFVKAGARYLDIGDRPHGTHYLARGLKCAPRDTRGKLLRKYGPFTARRYFSSFLTKSPR